MSGWSRVIEERSAPITPTADPEEWPYPEDEFVRAGGLDWPDLVAQLRERGPTAE